MAEISNRHLSAAPAQDGAAVWKLEREMYEGESSDSSGCCISKASKAPKKGQFCTHTPAHTYTLPYSLQNEATL